MNVIGQFTGLYDRRGKPIHVGDRLRFYPSPQGYYTGCIWEANVIFDDGVYTIDAYKGVAQIRNPKGWDRPHDYVSSRGWACEVGYGEYGNWNVCRESLTRIQRGFGHSLDCYNGFYKPLCRRYGLGKRYINAEIQGEEN